MNAKSLRITGIKWIFLLDLSQIFISFSKYHLIKNSFLLNGFVDLHYLTCSFMYFDLSHGLLLFSTLFSLESVCVWQYYSNLLWLYYKCYCSKREVYFFLRLMTSFKHSSWLFLVPYRDCVQDTCMPFKQHFDEIHLIIKSFLMEP